VADNKWISSVIDNKRISTYNKGISTYYGTITMGRKATGRNSRMTRVPLDCDIKRALQSYYEILPVLEQWAAEAVDHAPDEPRWTNVYRLLHDVGYISG